MPLDAATKADPTAGPVPNVPKLLQRLLTRRHYGQVLVLFVGMCIGALLEMVGVASVPFFVSLLITPDTPTTILPFGIGEFLSSLLSENHAIGYAAIALACFFVLKNLYLALLNYSEGRVLRNIRLEDKIRDRLCICIVNGHLIDHNGSRLGIPICIDRIPSFINPGFVHNTRLP